MSFEEAKSNLLINAFHTNKCTHTYYTCANEAFDFQKYFSIIWKIRKTFLILTKVKYGNDGFATGITLPKDLNIFFSDEKYKSLEKHID